MTTDQTLQPPGGVTRPAPGAPRPYHFPSFSRDALANGIEVIVAPVARLPIVTIRILVDAGASGDPLDHAGLAELAAQSLAEGTARADGARLAEDFERLGGALATSASWDGIHARTTVMRERFAAALALLAEVLLTPSFPEREVLRLREERLAELLEQRTEPRGLADDRFAAFLYGASSRFGLPEGGSERTVTALSRALAVEFHATRVRPTATTVLVVGDVERAQVLDAVSAVLGSWEGERSPAPPVLVDGARRERAVQVVCRPGAPQTEIRVGHVGIPRLHEDYFAVVVMNAILGGVFNSRINLNLRERHGFTYGASSGFDWRRAAGPFLASTAVATEVTAPALREIVREIDLMHTEPPRMDEVSLATSYLDGVFPIRFETTDAVAGALTALKSFGLPNDYYVTYRERIRGIGVNDVAHAAARHLHPERLQVVAVGDPERIGPDLEAAGMGPVSYVTPDGDPVVEG
jgi:zinc protease